MPTLMAGLVASVLGWIVEDWIQPFLGIAASAAVSLAVSSVCFFKVRAWLRDLRNE